MQKERGYLVKYAPAGVSINPLPAITLKPFSNWNFDETTGVSVVDSVSGHNGTATGTNVVPGKVGNAHLFSGTDYISIPNTFSLPSQNGAISLLVKPNSWAGTTDILGGGASGSDFRFLNQGGTSTLYGFFINGEYRINTGIGGIPPVGVWSHLVLTWDSSTGTKLYMDGVLIGKHPSPPPAYSKKGLTLGKFTSGGFSGLLDEVKVFNQALSDKEVADLYSTYKSTSPASDLIAYWNFDEASGNTVSDSAGSYVGTAQGTSIVPGKQGNARSFNGTDSVIIQSTFGLPSQTGTISLWVNPRSWSGSTDILGAGVGGSDFRFFNSNGSGALYGFYINGEYRVNTNTTGIPPIDTWTHLTLTWGSNGTKLYLNGVLKGTNTNTVPAYSQKGLSIGKFTSGGFNGTLDEVKVYNRTLSDSEVVNLYNTNNP